MGSCCVTLNNVILIEYYELHNHMSHCHGCGTNFNNEGEVKSAVSGLPPAVGLYLVSKVMPVLDMSQWTAETTRPMAIKTCHQLTAS